MKPGDSAADDQRFDLKETILREAERITNEVIALVPEAAREALCGYEDDSHGFGHKLHLEHYVYAARNAVPPSDYLLIDLAFFAIRWAVIASDSEVLLEQSLAGLLRATDALGKMYGIRMATDAGLAAELVLANEKDIASAERKRIAMKANAAKLANDPKQIAKAEAKAYFIAWQDGTGESFTGYADFGRKMVERLKAREKGKDVPALTDPGTVAEWCTKWKRELAQARSSTGDIRDTP